MFPRFVPALALAALVVTACRETQHPPSAPASSATGEESAYAAPPRVREVRLEGGEFRLAGQGPPNARVRLAQPSGEAVFAQADAEGRWSLSLPPAATVRVFGVSANVGGRTVQSQGYLLLSPEGKAAVLRAGGGAVRLDGRPAPRIDAFDFDGEGGAVVSGMAQPGAGLFLKLDGRQTGEGRADQSGRFEISLPSPVAPGGHSLEVSGEGFQDSIGVEVSAPASLDAGPIRTRAAVGGLRIDWRTPGGGVQSTVLVR